jgi:ribosomal protein L35
MSDFIPENNTSSSMIATTSLVSICLSSSESQAVVSTSTFTPLSFKSKYPSTTTNDIIPIYSQTNFEDDLLSSTVITKTSYYSATGGDENTFIDADQTFNHSKSITQKQDLTQAQIDLITKYAIICQKRWRMRSFRRHLFNLKVNNAEKNLKLVKQQIEQREREAAELYLKKVITCQQLIRLKHFRCRMRRFNQAAVVIQTKWRSFSCRQHYLKALEEDKLQKRIQFYTIKCQRLIRKKQLIKRLEDHAAHLKYERQIFLKNVIKCQRWIRMKNFRINLQLLKEKKRLEEEEIQLFIENIIKCQKMIRMKRFRHFLHQIKETNRLALEKAEQEHQHLIQTVITCQKLVRMKRFRSHFNQLKQQKRDNDLLKATLLVQRSFRYKQFKRCLETHRQVKRHNAARIIQMNYRYWRFRTRMAIYRTAAITIQTWFIKTMKQRRQFIQMRRSALLIQTRWRSVIQIKLKQQKLNAIITIQRWTRTMKDRYVYLQKRTIICQIQVIIL